MKADWCGTLTEQARHRMGWLSFGARNAKVANKELSAENKCGNCAELTTDHGTRCKKGDFATKVNNVCDAFQMRNAGDI